jgi:hypothetical protein
MAVLVAAVIFVLVAALRLTLAAGGHGAQTVRRVCRSIRSLCNRSDWVGRTALVAALAFLGGWLLVPAGTRTSTYYEARVAALIALLVIAVAGVLLLLTRATLRRLRRPGADRAAWLALEEMRVQAVPGGYELVHIVEEEWSTPGGTRTTVIHTSTGDPESVWWPDEHPAAGGLVLAERLSAGGLTAVATLDVAHLDAARRHARLIGVRFGLSPTARLEPIVAETEVVRREAD